MATTKYHFNKNTLTYEQVKLSVRQRIWVVMTHLISGIGVGVVFFLVSTYFFDSPYERQLKKENKLLVAQYKVLSRRMDENQKVLDDLQERDNHLYRAIFNAEPIPESVRRPGYGGTNRYESLLDMPNSNLIVSTTQKLDMMSKELYVQTNSYDEIVELIKTKEERMNCIPAIRPISGKDMKGVSSGFGMRLHPLWGDIRMHTGIDINANAGSAIFATGNGTVDAVGWDGGYGYRVIIDHGFGYKTLYGHCKTTLVRQGQRVTRGQKIATVGMTGDASGNHLHYEVRVKNKCDNPAKYFFMDLTPEEYDEMMYISENR
ncbi:MAG: M23 family metallopeptidase [Dysgonamonadaceae bacterium]|jgi:murein DD-endopeptidase MepM/ murein hydrolase activator NlpD|nr:M23 family metallopeptidase [Dysgonamonadaceae bacterium]